MKGHIAEFVLFFVGFLTIYHLFPFPFSFHFLQEVSDHSFLYEEQCNMCFG